MAPQPTIQASNLDRLIYEKTSPYAVAPERACDHSVGYVLCSSEEHIKIIKPNERVAISTGLSFVFPPGTYGRICGRFSAELHRRFSVLSTCIDPHPLGGPPVHVLIHNSSDSPIEIHPGDRICLMVLERFFIAEVEEYDPLKVVEPPLLCSENLLMSPPKAEGGEEADE